MSARITSTEGVVALFDSTTGHAFGEVFSDEYVADDFLKWLAWSAAQENTYNHSGTTRTIRADARSYTMVGLAAVRNEFNTALAGWEEAVSRSVTNPAQTLGFMGWLEAGRP